MKTYQKIGVCGMLILEPHSLFFKLLVYGGFSDKKKKKKKKNIDLKFKSQFRYPDANMLGTWFSISIWTTTRSQIQISSNGKLYRIILNLQYFHNKSYITCSYW